jgi:ribosomal protein S18 acetylase RimI-like enzyme
MGTAELTSPLLVQPLAATTRDDTDLIAALTTLVNTVYATSEAGLWTGKADRTSPREMAGLVGAGEIAVARLDGRIVGCVRVQRLDDGLGEFGLLAADPAHQGIGIGRELIRFAERTSRAVGARTMQLELLVPRDWSHPSKAQLNGWYTRLGYRRVRLGSVEEAYPTLAPLLATPCDFVIYHKPLTDRPT